MRGWSGRWTGRRAPAGVFLGLVLLTLAHLAGASHGQAFGDTFGVTSLGCAHHGDAVAAGQPVPPHEHTDDAHLAHAVDRPRACVDAPAAELAATEPVVPPTPGRPAVAPGTSPAPPGGVAVLVRHGVRRQ